MERDFKEQYTFMYSSTTGTSITFEMEDVVDLDSIINRFNDFLHGCGFSFDGNLEIVDPIEEKEIEE